MQRASGADVVVRIAGKRTFMWRAVDKEDEVLDVFVQKRRTKAVALKLLRKLLKKQGFRPEKIGTDGLRSYKAAMRELGCLDRHDPGDCRRTIGRKIQIFRSGEDSERCSASSPRVRRSASFKPTLLSTTPSQSSIISLPGKQGEIPDRPPLPSGPPRPPQPRYVI